MINLLVISSVLFYFVFLVTVGTDPYYITFAFILSRLEFTYKELTFLFTVCVAASALIYAGLALDNIVFYLPFLFYLRSFVNDKYSEDSDLMKTIDKAQLIIIPACLVSAIFTQDMGNTLAFTNFKLSKIFALMQSVVTYSGCNILAVYDIVVKNLHVVSYIRYQQSFIFEYFFMSKFYTNGFMQNKVKMNPISIFVFFGLIFSGILSCLFELYFVFYLIFVLICLNIGYISAFGELRFFSNFSGRRQGILFTMIFRQIIYNFIYYFTQNDFSSLNFNLVSRYNRSMKQKSHANYTDYIILFFFLYEIIYQLIDFLQDVKD